jgi:hypothetical protein
MIHPEFDQRKTQFFRDIKADEHVLAAHAEADISLLFDDLMQYVNLVNSASHVHETKKNKKLSSMLDQLRGLTSDIESTELTEALDNVDQGVHALVEERRRPIQPHIDDITDIAYTVGTTSKKDRRKALVVAIDKNQQNLQELIEKGIMDGRFFTNDTKNALSILTSDAQTQKKQDALARLLEIASDYMNRSIALRRLGDGESMITNYRFEEMKHTLSQFAKGDFTHITAMWGSSRTLTSGRITELSRCFVQQADVNAIKFKTLVTIIHILVQNPDPIEATEKLYNKFMEDYNQWGYVEANLSMGS